MASDHNHLVPNRDPNIHDRQANVHDCQANAHDSRNREHMDTMPCASALKHSEVWGGNANAGGIATAY